jgi:hypothetical protein
MGTAAWIGAMKEQYRCARCGRTNDWFRDSCGNCGAGLVNGRNPGPAAGKA